MSDHVAKNPSTNPDEEPPPDKDFDEGTMLPWDEKGEELLAWDATGEKLLPVDGGIEELTPAEERHLGQLATAWQILATLLLLVSLYPGFGVLYGIAMALGVGTADPGAAFVESLETFLEPPQGAPTPRAHEGLGLAILALLPALALWTTAAVMFYTARLLREQRRWTHAYVSCWVLTVCVPLLGTVLGAATVAVMMRPSARATFERNDNP